HELLVRQRGGQARELAIQPGELLAQAVALFPHVDRVSQRHEHTRAVGQDLMGTDPVVPAVPREAGDLGQAVGGALLRVARRRAPVVAGWPTARTVRPGSTPSSARTVRTAVTSACTRANRSSASVSTRCASLVGQGACASSGCLPLASLSITADTRILRE